MLFCDIWRVFPDRITYNPQISEQVQHMLKVYLSLKRNSNVGGVRKNIGHGCLQYFIWVPGKVPKLLLLYVWIFAISAPHISDAHQVKLRWLQQTKEDLCSSVNRLLTLLGIVMCVWFADIFSIVQLVDFCQLWHVYYPYLNKLLWKKCDKYGFLSILNHVVPEGVNQLYFFVWLVSHKFLFETST